MVVAYAGYIYEFIGYHGYCTLFEFRVDVGNALGTCQIFTEATDTRDVAGLGRTSEDGGTGI